MLFFCVPTTTKYFFPVGVNQYGRPQGLKSRPGISIRSQPRKRKAMTVVIDDPGAITKTLCWARRSVGHLMSIKEGCPDGSTKVAARRPFSFFALPQPHSSATHGGSVTMFQSVPGALFSGRRKRRRFARRRAGWGGHGHHGHGHGRWRDRWCYLVVDLLSVQGRPRPYMLDHARGC